MGDKLIMYSGLDEPSARPRVGLERPAGLATAIERSDTHLPPSWACFASKVSPATTRGRQRDADWHRALALIERSQACTRFCPELCAPAGGTASVAVQLGS